MEDTKVSKNKKIGVGVGVYIIKNNKILLGERLGSHGKGSWAAPGGHLEFGESWAEAAIRETKEETGLDIKNLEFIGLTNDIFDKNKHYVTIVMACDWTTGEPRVTEPDKCLGWEWFSIDEIPENTFLTIKDLMKSDFKHALIERVNKK